MEGDTYFKKHNKETLIKQRLYNLINKSLLLRFLN